MSTFEQFASALATRYEIVREIGAGGMATVYLARDIKHQRDVAIKVLHPELAAALGAERFLSEIRTTANLHHPHILPLHDSGDADGFLFYVMPYVDGETLRTRLTRERQLPIADAVRIAREVADALGYAHGRGVIHRDIKPENVLLQGGHALVADFGIALAVQSAGGARMTQTGLSLGTPQYMSPEQAMGERTIDARSDVYALGAVTYEMLTGDAPFTGSSGQVIVAKVLSERPTPIRTLRDTVPLEVEDAVLAALAKIPADRFATAMEFATALSDVRRVHAAPAVAKTEALSAAAPTSSASERRRGMVMAAVTLVAMAAAAGWLVGQRSRVASTSNRTSTRFALETHPGERLPNILGQVHAISPDGTTLVYVASAAGKTQQLWRRRFDELDAAPIAGTPGASDPAFSADGRWIAFVQGSQIVKVPVDGGIPIRLAAIANGAPRGIAWLPSGEIVFANTGSSALSVVGGDGSNAREVFTSQRTIAYRWPVAIPGSEDVLFTEFSPSGDTIRLAVGSIRDGKAVRLAADMFAAVGVVEGYLVYLTRSGEIRAVAYDVSKRAVKGRAIRIATGVQMSPGTGLGYASLSKSGDLAFREGTPMSELVLVNASAQARALLPDTLAFEHPRVSPDGKSIALSIETSGRKGIWLFNRANGILSRLSEEEDVTIRDRAEWTPDGRTVMYRRNSPVGNAYVQRAADRSGAEMLVAMPKIAVNELVMAPDGRTVLARCAAGTYIKQDICSWTLPDTSATNLTNEAGFETGPRFSPDGKWVAYASETAGRREIFLSPFPGPGGRIQVSQEGAGAPVWSRDGRIIYYPQGRRLMAAALSFTPSVSVASTRTVLEGDFAFYDALHATFDVTQNGEFVLVRPVRDARTVVIRDILTEIRNQSARQGAD